MYDVSLTLYRVHVIGVSEAYCAVIHLPFVPIGAGRLPFAANIKSRNATSRNDVDGI